MDSHQPLKVLTNENRCGLNLISFDRSPFKLFSLRFSNKSVKAPSRERPKTAQRTLFLLFANNNWIPISASCLAATNFPHHTLISVICNNGIVHPPWYLRWRQGSAHHQISFQITENYQRYLECRQRTNSDVWIHHVACKFRGFFHKPRTLYRYWETIIDFKWQKQGSLSNSKPLTGLGLHQFVWKFPRDQLKARSIEWYHCQPARPLVNTFNLQCIEYLRIHRKPLWK